jgi:hypothetical protein
MISYLHDVAHDISFDLEVNPSADNYSDLLACKSVKKVDCKIGKSTYIAICDSDELSETISAVDTDNNPILTGNIIIHGRGKDGAAADLTQKDISNIENHITVSRTKSGKLYRIITVED